MTATSIELVSGHIGAGKTTYGREAVRGGRADVHIELDDIAQEQGDNGSAKQLDDPNFLKMRQRVYDVARARINGAEGKRVVVTGVWPGEDGAADLLGLVPTPVLVELPHLTEEAARKRVVERADTAELGKAFGLRFDEIMKQVGGWDRHLANTRWNADPTTAKSALARADA